MPNRLRYVVGNTERFKMIRIYACPIVAFMVYLVTGRYRTNRQFIRKPVSTNGLSAALAG
jgi:hypothetical protein